MSLAPARAIWTSTAFDIVEHEPDMEQAVAALRDVLQVDHVVYHSSRFGASPSIEPYVRLTYPASWVKRYLQMDYVKVDPVLREGFKRTLPFAWSDLTISTAQEVELLHDALKHGIGPHGLSIPVRSKRGHRGLFSMSYSGSAERWSEFRTTNMVDLVEVAHRLHKRVITEEFGPVEQQLTTREVDCLFWIAQGKEAAEIAVILNISTHTARDYIKSARYKLGCATSTQAISKAFKLGLISL